MRVHFECFVDREAGVSGNEDFEGSFGLVGCEEVREDVQSYWECPLSQCLLEILLYVRIKCPAFGYFYLSGMTYGRM